MKGFGCFIVTLLSCLILGLFDLLGLQFSGKVQVWGTPDCWRELQGDPEGMSPPHMEIVPRNLSINTHPLSPPKAYDSYQTLQWQNFKYPARLDSDYIGCDILPLLIKDLARWHCALTPAPTPPPLRCPARPLPVTHATDTAPKSGTLFIRSSH